MKKSMFFIGLIFIVFTFHANSQDILESQVPSVVLNHFTKEFPKAKDIDWEEEGDFYKVDFEVKRRIDFEIWYDSDGTVIREEKEIIKSGLSKPVEESIASDFPGYRIGDITRITEGESIHYQVELDSRTKGELDILFDADGKVLNSEMD